MSIDLIKDNYLRGSGNGPTWHVDVDPPKRKVGTYFEETLLATEYVNANKEGKLYLLFSGGLDSQYIFNVLIHLGIEFIPVIIRLRGAYYYMDYNFHETKQAFEKCRQYQIEPMVVQFDFDEFVRSGEICRIAEECRIGSYMIPATMKIAEQLGKSGGFVLMGNDPPYMKYNKERDIWQLEELETIHSILNFFRIRQVPGCPFLPSYTAEMMLAFLLDPTMQDVAAGKFPGKEGTNSTKVHVFNNGSGFNMPNYDFSDPRKKKFTGYEVINRVAISLHPNIQKFEKEYRPKWGGIYFEDYDKVIERLKVNQ